MYQVYILQNTQKKRYIGISENIQQRLEQHNTGISQWTAKNGSWTLIWQSEQMNLTEARKLENKLKRAKGGNSFYALTGLPRS